MGVDFQSMRFTYQEGQQNNLRQTQTKIKHTSKYELHEGASRARHSQVSHLLTSTSSYPHNHTYTNGLGTMKYFTANSANCALPTTRPKHSVRPTFSRKPFVYRKAVQASVMLKPDAAMATTNQIALHEVCRRKVVRVFASPQSIYQCSTYSQHRGLWNTSACDKRITIYGTHTRTNVSRGSQRTLRQAQTITPANISADFNVTFSNNRHANCRKHGQHHTYIYP